MQTSLPLSSYPGASAFLRSYSADFARVAPWFHYDPHDPACFAARLAELDARPVVDRSGYAAAAAAQQLRWGAGAEAVAAAESLGQPGCYSIVTGQQVGLFGGPLYTQLKALHAVLLAQRLQAQFPDRRFVPTFWLGTGDSDYDEVRTAHVLDREGQVRGITLPPAPPEDEGQLVGARDVRAHIAVAIDELEQALPGGEHREAAVRLLRETYLAPERGNTLDDGLAGGFARYMARLFTGTELVLLDAQDPALLPAALPLLERELTAAAQIEAALLERNAQLSAAGISLQVEHLPGDTGLFLLDAAQRRRKLSRDANGFCLRHSGEHFSLDELLQLAHSAVQRFVPGVMLRPLYQNTLFPPAAFIGGGAELAYRAQATAVFDAHGMRMAPALFRASATLLSAKSAAVLDELGLELGDCYVVPQELAARAVAHARPAGVEAALAQYRDVLHSADRELEAQAVAFDPSLAETFTTLRGNLERHLEKLEKKLTSSLKQRHETLLRRLALAQAQACPQLAPQERMLGLTSFLPRHGEGLLHLLLVRLDHKDWYHQLIVLD